MPALDSEALIAVHYDPVRRVLRAVFRESRRAYDYFGVTQQEYDDLLAADSKGAWFNTHIKEHHPFEEVARR